MPPRKNNKRNAGKEDAERDHYNELRWQKEAEEQERLAQESQLDKSVHNYDIVLTEEPGPIPESEPQDPLDEQVLEESTLSPEPVTGFDGCDEMNDSNIWYKPEEPEEQAEPLINTELPCTHDEGITKIDTAIKQQRLLLDELDKQVKEMIQVMDTDRRKADATVVLPAPKEPPCCVIS